MSADRPIEVADSLDRAAVGLVDSRHTDGTVKGERENVAEFLTHLRGQPYHAAIEGFVVRWPRQGDTLVLRRHGRDLARLVQHPGVLLSEAEIAAFHEDVLAALRPSIDGYRALTPTDRVRRRLSALGFRTDLTRRQWSVVVGPRHWVLTDRVDFCALDRLLATRSPGLVRGALDDVFRAVVDPWFRAETAPHDAFIEPLADALRVAPAHVLLRTYLRHCPNDDPAADPRGTAVVRWVDPENGRNVAVVYHRTGRIGGAVVAYDLDHAHRVPVPPGLRGAGERAAAHPAATSAGGRAGADPGVRSRRRGVLTALRRLFGG